MNDLLQAPRSGYEAMAEIERKRAIARRDVTGWLLEQPKRSLSASYARLGKADDCTQMALAKKIESHPCSELQ